MSLDDGKWLPKIWVPTPKCYACPRHKENQVYHEIYHVDKQVNIYILNFSSKQKYMSAMKSSNYCIFNHQNYQLVVGQWSTKLIDNFPIFKHNFLW